jgi:hypothetical protein
MTANSAKLITDRRARTWFAAVVAATLALLCACAAFVWWVDPFQQYRLASRYPPRFYTLHHRYINPGLAKHQSYDTVVSGSSIMESTPNSVVARHCGGSAVNLSMPAMSASERGLMLGTAFESRPVQRAILVLDFNEFAGEPEQRQEVAGPLPDYLYDRNPFNDLPYLLSWNLLLRSWDIVRGVRSESYRSDPDAPWFWGQLKRFGRDEVLRGLDLQHLNARFQQPQRTLPGMRASFERNVLPLLRAHPQTEFDLVWPPYSILVWLDFAQRDQLDVSLAFKRYVFEATRDLPNVSVVDLQDERAITHDLDRYTDLYHFDPEINERLIEAACSGRARTTVDRLDQSERSLRDQVEEIRTPAGLALLVGPHGDGRGGAASPMPAAPPVPRR